MHAHAPTRPIYVYINLATLIRTRWHHVRQELKKHIKETDKDKAARAILDARLADQRAHYTSLEEANNTLRTQLDTAVEHLQELEKVSSTRLFTHSFTHSPTHPLACV